MPFLLTELGNVWEEAMHQFLDISYICIALLACILYNACEVLDDSIVCVVADASAELCNGVLH